MQIFACDAKSGDGPELGYIASARNLAKLNAISPAVYPLPAATTAPSGEDIFIPDESEEPDATADAEDAVEEVAVTVPSSNSQHLVQIRVQGTVNAGRSPYISSFSYCRQPGACCMHGEPALSSLFTNANLP